MESCGGSDEASYRIYSLSVPRGENSLCDIEPSDYVIKAENYGIPQARHRVIVLGVRSTNEALPRVLPQGSSAVRIEDVIGDLPRLRSRLSREDDSEEAWKCAVNSLVDKDWFVSLDDDHLRQKILQALASLLAND